jgi:putative hydrolase of the HAD superfamily
MESMQTRPTLRLVFDLDDTLYPERDYALGGFRAAADYATQAWGVPDLAPDMTRLLDTGMLGKLFAQVLTAAKPDATPDDIAAFVKAYGAHTPQLKLFPDAADVLDHYRASGPLGLITDGHAKTQAAKVAALEVAPRFQSIVYTGALGPDRAFHKPHPKAFEMTEAVIGQAGDRFVYVGDNPAKDFAAPNARGWTTVHIVRTGGIHGAPAAIAGGEAHHQITSLMQLPGLLGG